jgi:hypothetical protein
MDRGQHAFDKIHLDIIVEERRQNEADGMHSSSELIFIVRNTILFIIQNIGDENPKESFRTVCSLEKTM